MIYICDRECGRFWMGINLSFAQFWQAIPVWPHSEIFTGQRPVKMLVGELPKPAELLDTLSRSPGASALLSAARS